jgi:alkanesulfonate monooxygenase SsuD/methylene tetrahydromethanopterin reductase-like flavin-dependent oxidoreductase (luciferase family)
VAGGASRVRSASLKALWTEPRVTFAGDYYRLTDAHSAPRPVQRPHPPLWIGSSGERYGLRAVARHADVWVNASMNPEDLDELGRLSRILDRHCEQIGRDPATIRRAVQFRLPDGDEATLRSAQRFAAAGFTDILFMPYTGGARRVDQLAALLPRLRTLG